MRAAAMDFRTARLLGVRANRVIGVGGAPLGAARRDGRVILTVQNPLVTPDFALADTIVVLAGVVVGGMNRLLTATLGGFSIGFVTGLIGGALPDRPEPVPAVGRLRSRHPRAAHPPGRAVRPTAAARWSGCEQPRRSIQLGRPGRPRRARRRSLGTLRLDRDRDLLPERARLGRDRRRDLRLRRQLRRALVRPHQLRRRRRLGGRRALGAGRPRSRRSCRTSSRSSATTRSGTSRRCSLAAAVGGLYALLVGLPLMRLSGLAAGIATFGVLEITHNLLRVLREDRPGLEHLLVGARDDRPAAGDGRRAARDRRRLRLPVEPLRSPAARDARGSRPQRGRSASPSTGSG